MKPLLPKTLDRPDVWCQQQLSSYVASNIGICIIGPVYTFCLLVLLKDQLKTLPQHKVLYWGGWGSPPKILAGDPDPFRPSYSYAPVEKHNCVHISFLTSYLAIPAF